MRLLYSRSAHEVITATLDLLEDKEMFVVDALDLTGLNDVKQSRIIDSPLLHTLARMIGYDYVLVETRAVHRQTTSSRSSG
jgi:hypothetical protein